MSARSHVECARNPQGEAGKLLLDTMNSGNHERMSLWTLDQLDISPARILDIGCGGGANLARFLIKYPQSYVVGVDYSELACEHSRAMVRFGIHDKRCEVIQASVEALPFDDASFDLVSAFETIYFWPHIQDTLKEVARVIKPGGYLLVVNETDGRESEPGHYDGVSDLMQVYSQTDLVALLEEAGFTSIDVAYKEDTGWIKIMGQKA